MAAADAKELTLAAPAEWYEEEVPTLPMKGERINKHSWLVDDRYILFDDPVSFWRDHRLENNIEIVFGMHQEYPSNNQRLITAILAGTTAQAEATEASFNSMEWNNTDFFMSMIENRLASFNVTLPKMAINLYNTTENDNWQIFASMISDIKTVCPLQKLAVTASNNFVSNVYSYVVST